LAAVTAMDGRSGIVIVVVLQKSQAKDARHLLIFFCPNPKR
jgi:hypothetical protein